MLSREHGGAVMNDLNIRGGRAEDLDAMLALLPRLADFPLPPGRAAEDTYRGDGKTLKAWAKDRKPQCRVTVAEDGAGLLGFTLVRLQPEFMSGAPSAHLEVIIIDPRADGTGGEGNVVGTEGEGRRHRYSGAFDYRGNRAP